MNPDFRLNFFSRLKILKISLNYSYFQQFPDLNLLIYFVSLYIVNVLNVLNLLPQLPETTEFFNSNNLSITIFKIQ